MDPAPSTPTAFCLEVHVRSQSLMKSGIRRVHHNVDGDPIGFFALKSGPQKEDQQIKEIAENLFKELGNSIYILVKKSDDSILWIYKDRGVVTTSTSRPEIDEDAPKILRLLPLASAPGAQADQDANTTSKMKNLFFKKKL